MSLRLQKIYLLAASSLQLHVGGNALLEPLLAFFLLFIQGHPPQCDLLEVKEVFCIKGQGNEPAIALDQAATRLGKIVRQGTGYNERARELAFSFDGVRYRAFLA